MANRFLNNIRINDEYTLPAADGTADQIIVTDGAGNLSFIDTTTISVGESEQVHIACKNTSGVPISKGDPVYITGTVGTSFRVQIAAADASNSAKMPAVGLAESDLANNAEGYVIVSGVLKNLTTDPLSTGDGTPSSNDTVYVKAGGGLTRTKPTGSSNLIQNVGKVGRVNSANAGSIAVSTIMRTNDVPNLTAGKIWVGSSTYTTESTVVHLDESNGRMGIGTPSPSQALTVEGNIELGTGGYIYGDTTTPQLRLNHTYGSFLQYGSSSYVGVGSNVVTFRTSSSERMRIDSSGNVGIGTTSPSYKLTSYENTAAGAIVASFGNPINVNAYTAIGLSGFTASNGANKAGIALKRTGNYGTGELHFLNNNTLDNSDITLSDSKMMIDSSGNVGIGTTSPQKKLEIKSTTAYDSTIRLQTSLHSWDIQGGEAGYSSTAFAIDYDGTTFFRAMGSGDNRFGGGLSVGSVNTAPPSGGLYVAGNVGIGTTSPDQKLHVEGSVLIDSYTTNGVEGGIYFREGFDGSLNKYNLSILNYDHSGAGTTSTDGLSINGYDGVSFCTGSNTRNERMRITSSGNVGIGTISPGTKLDVAGDTPIIRLTDTRNLNVGDWDDVTLGKIQFYTSDTTSPGARSIAEIEAYSGPNAASGPESQLRFNTLASTETNPSTKMVVQALGNVGIGTTDPTFKLQVQGTLYSTNATFGVNGGDRITISNRANNDVAVESHAAELFLSSGYNGISFEGSANTTLMKLTDSGNLGIGTTAPGANLEIRKSASDGVGPVLRLRADDSNDGNPEIQLYRGTGSTVGSSIWLSNGNTDLYFDNRYAGSSTFGRMFFRTQVAGTPIDALTIMPGGNIGIGTTTPAAKLDVNGDINISTTSNSYKINNINALDHSTTYTRLYNPEGAIILYGGDSADRSNYYDNDVHRFRPAGGGSYYGLWNSTGFGIGTTGPAYKLDVNGTIRAVGNTYLQADTYIGTSTSAYMQFNRAGYNYIAATEANGAMVFRTGGTSNRMIITAAGDVGIGTLSPSYKLHVDGGIRAGGKVTYLKQYGSLDTTGNAVAGITTGSNGGSCNFTFTCTGNTGGYQRIVYSCYCASTTWNTVKVIDEGTNDFDVEASANGTTITFTFKSTSGTKYYTPTVLVEAFGTSINSTYA